MFIIEHAKTKTVYQLEYEQLQELAGDYSCRVSHNIFPFDITGYLPETFLTAEENELKYTFRRLVSHRLYAQFDKHLLQNRRRRENTFFEHLYKVLMIKPRNYLMTSDDTHKVVFNPCSAHGYIPRVYPGSVRFQSLFTHFSLPFCREATEEQLHTLWKEKVKQDFWDMIYHTQDKFDYTMKRLFPGDMDPSKAISIFMKNNCEVSVK